MNTNEGLLAAAKEGNLSEVIELVSKGANVNAKDTKANHGWTAMMWATGRGYKEVIKFLLDKGADVNEKDNYSVRALDVAASGGHTEIARILLDKGRGRECKR